MRLRPFTDADVDALAGLYRESVLTLGPSAYAADQVAAWASFTEDVGAFQSLLAKGFTLIADVDEVPAAFCQLHPADHVSFLYTHPQYTRRGLARAVYRGIEAHARELGQTALTTDASKISRPFFESEGFVVCRAEQTIRKGISITRYQMEKKLATGDP